MNSRKHISTTLCTTDTKMQKYAWNKHCFILWVVLSCMVVINGCLENEKIGLLKLKDAISNNNGAYTNTIILPSWGGEELDCCRWEGITCDDLFSKRIVNLSLSFSDQQNTSRQSAIDASLFQPFQQLLNLTIVGGLGVTGALRLPKLQVLDLHANFVISHVPFTGELQSLKFLELYENSINHDDFQELAKLSSLELLDLGYNEIAGKIPPSILALTSLKMLGLSNNKLNGSLPEGLCTFTNLEELDLSTNDFEGVIPACLGNFTSLRLLDLSNNRFSGSIPSNFFSSLNSLEYVSLSYNFFDGLVSFGSFADNSKLKVFELESYNPKLKVETENVQWKSPFFQLERLRLSNCILNEPSGRVIPSFLLSQFGLIILDLSNNGMTGELPSWLLANNSKLEHLSLQNNRFFGQLMLQPDAFYFNMNWLDLSMNQVTGEIPAYIGFILPNLSYLNMSTNAIDGSIPTSIENMKTIEYMDLSNNHLSGRLIGKVFSGLTMLKLSNNSLEGNLTDFFSNNLRFLQLMALYLDNNNFSGDLQLQTLNIEGGQLMLLDISYNSITGRFPDWIAELSQLETLVLSKNHFQGKLPTSLCKLVNIQILDLSWNNFSDTIPPCTQLSKLQFLHLQSNGFHGPLPSSLSKSSSIVTLDVRDNKFSGLIPSWINILSELKFLLLKGNIFYCSIPLEICQMKNLRILDFAANNLSGSVPPCFSQIPFGKTQFLDYGIPFVSESIFGSTSITSSESFNGSRLHVIIDSSESQEAQNVPEEVQFIAKSVYESYKGGNLYLMVGIDLSLNNLNGPIPMHFCNWDNVRSLNLSYNYFNGSISETLSSLINLESLDLSHNMLSDKIPSEITELRFLEVFSVAYNYLSGSTPTTTGQFATFEARSYEGNPLLCGPPLDRSCSGEPTILPHAKPFAEPEQNDSSFRTLFLWSFFGSFVVSCIGSFVFFYFSTNVPQRFLVWIGVEERVPCRITVELPWQ